MNINVLVVDKNPIDREYIINEIGSLNFYSYKVSETDDFEKAKDLVLSNEINLMFLNLSLHDTKGIETFIQFEQRFPSIAKIILTEKSSDAIRNELLERGAQDFLIKGSFNKDELFKTINYAIERNKTRTALLEAKTFFHSTIDSLSASIAILDANGTIIYVNKSWIEFARANNSKMANDGIGLNYIEIALKSDDEEKIGNIVASAIIDIIEGRKKKFFIEYPCHSPLEKRWFSLSLTHFEQNNKRRVVATHENITQRKEAEEAKSTSDKIFNHSLDMLCIAGFDGYFKVLNPAWNRTLGWSNEELISKPWIEFVYPDDRSKTENIKSKIVNGQEVYQFENRYISKDGGIKWLSWDTFPYMDENIMFSVARDITEKNQRKDKLKTISQAIEQSPVSIMVTDIKGNIEYVNPKFSEVSGYSSEEVIGKNPRILKAGEKTTTNYESLWKTISSGKEWTGEFHNKKKNGETYWEYAKISPVINEKGVITSYVGVKEDITRRKTIETELLESKKEAEKSDRLKSEFLTQISHEIRTPVNTMLSFSSLIEEELKDSLSADLKESFDYMGNAGRRLIRTIDLIVKMSELQTDNYRTEFKENDIGELLAELVEVYRPLAEEKNLTFQFIKISDKTKIIFDKKSIYDVFSNLIDNAIKYTRKGGIKIYIKKTLLNKISVEVTDTGIGISEKYFNDIFKPFSQETNGYSRIFDGNGLGLTLVKNLCDLNNAEVYINSQLGVGSTFVVIFK